MITVHTTAGPRDVDPWALAESVTLQPGINHRRDGWTNWATYLAIPLGTDVDGALTLENIWLTQTSAGHKHASTGPEGMRMVAEAAATFVRAASDQDERDTWADRAAHLPAACDREVEQHRLMSQHRRDYWARRFAGESALRWEDFVKTVQPA